MESFGLMTLFEVCVGAYLIYAAIKGDGKLYENEFLNCSREEYVSVMRKLAVITGLLMLISSGLELGGLVETGSVLSWVLWAVTLGSIVVMMVYSSKKTDKQAARAGKPTQAAPDKPHDPLRAAFVFDEEDENGEQGE